MVLDHIAIIVSKEENLEFYKKLGFKEINRFDRTQDTVIFMECDGIVLEVFVDSNHPERISNPETKGLRHMALTVNRIEDLDVEIEPIRADFYGRRFTFTKDLDGQPIELKER